ncbi:MAG: ACT domain-containing protein [Firmicutes bacterium]|nr:ACT domain-containing protein [Bacillota bacterium]
MAAELVGKAGDMFLSCPTFLDVLTNVHTASADCAVVPIENSIEGIVNEVTDGLIFGIGAKEHSFLYINAEFSIPIENYLIAQKGAGFSCIKTIITHWQPYGQCRHTLKKLFPDAKVIYADSTSAALSAIADVYTVTVGGKQLLSDAYVSSEFSVNDAPNNRTRFAVLSTNDISDTKNTKITIVFETKNRPGALVEILQIFKYAGLNMTRLESRPHKSQLGRYIFIADILGNTMDKKTVKALEQIRQKSEFYKYLGGYKLNET